MTKRYVETFSKMKEHEPLENWLSAALMRWQVGAFNWGNACHWVVGWLYTITLNMGEMICTIPV